MLARQALKTWIYPMLVTSQVPYNLHDQWVVQAASYRVHHYYSLVFVGHIARVNQSTFFDALCRAVGIINRHYSIKSWIDSAALVSSSFYHGHHVVLSISCLSSSSHHFSFY